MAEPPVERLVWRRRDVLSLLALSALCAGWLGLRAIRRPVRLGRTLLVDRRKVLSADERINPNTASPASLRRLPDIGPARAGAIIEYRSRHGPRAFRTAADLQKVAGIGPAIARRIAPYLSLPAGGD